MKHPKFLKVLAVFLLVGVTSGCRIEFDGDSIVREDGSIERTTYLKAQETADKEEILSRYELAPGGEWAQSILPVFKFLKQEPVDEALSTYKSTRLFAPSEQPATDFKRYTPKKDRAATNQFQVKIEDWWLAKRFSYEEVYSDIIDAQKIQLVLDQILEKGLTTFRAELSTRTTDKAFVDKICAEIKNKYSSLLKRYYDLVAAKGWDFEEVSKLSEEIEKEMTPEAVSKLMKENLKAYDKEPNRKIIGEAFHASEPAMAEFFESNRTLWSDDYAIFGAHGFAIFHYYDFKVRVTMPGHIVWSNASSRSGNRLEWAFGSSKMNQELMARSLRIYWTRVLAVGFVLIILIGFLIFLLIGLIRKGKK